MEVKIGNKVCLKHANNVFFVVTENLGEEFDGAFPGMYKITRIDTLNSNNPVQMDVHKDALLVIED